MSLNESISVFVSQGIQELTTAQISFGLKLLVIFGVIFLFNTVAKTGGSIIELLIYIVGLLKWIFYKLRGKDI